MRLQLCAALVERAARPETVFLTGDLGFMALEDLQAALGPRFINAGVAEQNMVSVGAAMAAQGMEVWLYSIAPFMYARPFEQIRNDICFHNLPVKLIGNGGGYGYGVMGPTHHAIDDYGALLTLPGMSVLVPAFDEDVSEVVAMAGESSSPTYLRMGRGEPPSGWEPPPFEPWRQVTEGQGPVLIGVGPVIGPLIGPLEALPVERRPALWLAGALPIERHPLPPKLLDQLSRSGTLIVVEEHVRQGSCGTQVAAALLEAGCAPARFRHLYATAHNFGRYGSQQYMRRRAGLDPASVMALVETR